ncbi:response regulator [Pilimelia terevasa]|uniref:Response regulator n=1 Tax=Pilimelia terevasa TaxID=53372 RepID=A0A8J3BPG2_9ACTN|nr:response regulator [Pilimelia terevasa]GGK25825.1 response regulator [Pilimelia terevasa]
MALITVAEDDDDLRPVIVRVLERAGHEVVAVGDGGAGLAELRRRRPDVLVTDLDMPVLTGTQMCRRAAAEGLLDGVLIMVVSGALPRGADPHDALPTNTVLRKPFTGTDLLRCLRALMDPSAPTP